MHIIIVYHNVLFDKGLGDHLDKSVFSLIQEDALSR